MIYLFDSTGNQWEVSGDINSILLLVELISDPDELLNELICSDIVSDVKPTGVQIL